MKDSVGIRSIQIALPKKAMTLDEMSRLSGIPTDALYEEIGVLQKPVLEKSETALQYGISAAKALLEKESLDPRSIDYVFYGCLVPEDLVATSAPRVQKEIGAVNAFSYDFRGGCHSGNIGLDLAKMYLTCHEKNRALIVLGAGLSRTVDHEDKKHSCLFNFADGACAILVERGFERNQILTFAASTNARFADSVFQAPTEQHVVMIEDAAEDRALLREYFERYKNMILEALSKAGLLINQVDHLFMNQGDHRLIRKLAPALPIDPNKIFRSHDNFGHVGPVDCFLGLKSRMDEGLIHPGQHIVLASSSVGYSWGAVVLKG